MVLEVILSCQNYISIDSQDETFELLENKKENFTQALFAILLPLAQTLSLDWDSWIAYP